jgi:hypothetical protein
LPAAPFFLLLNSSPSDGGNVAKLSDLVAWPGAPLGVASAALFGASTP